jgi:PadR family transcriptional regulator
MMLVRRIRIHIAHMRPSCHDPSCGRPADPLTRPGFPHYVVAQYMAAHTELKRGTAALMVLAVLEGRARHGYEIARLIDDRSNGMLRFHVASLYPMLYRLERRGWIDGRWVEKAGQRRRRYYRLTPRGRKMLGAERNSWHQVLTALKRVAGLDPVT